MTKLIVLIAFAVSAIGLGGCTGSSQAGLLPKEATATHVVHMLDNGGGGIPCC